MNIRDTFCVRGDGLRRKKKNESGSFRREYGEKCNVAAGRRHRVSMLMKTSRRILSGQNNFNESGRGSTLRPSSCVTRLHRVDKDEERSRFEIISPTFREGPTWDRGVRVPLKYPGDFRGLIAGVISVRLPRLCHRQRARGPKDLINACQIVPANPAECCGPSATADSRPAAAEHQFVCRGNKRKHQSPRALPDACARLQCILNILPVVQRLSADVALVYLCLASETTPADRAEHA